MRRFATMAVVSALLCALAHGSAAQQAATSYDGTLADRSTLTGDWGGARDDLAAKGFTIEADVTQIAIGVIDGGIDQSWQYEGRADLNAHLDTGKAGWWPGGFFDLELEGAWNKSVNGATGALLPVDSNRLFPTPTGDVFGVPRWTFTQFLSTWAGVSIGKQQTISDGDNNEFAHGKGAEQFFNIAFNINPTLLVVPYSTLGAVAVLLPTEDADHAIVTAGVFSATGSATKAGFDDINGAIFASGGRLRTDFFGLTGHQTLGALYSNKSYTSLDQRLGFVIDDQLLQRKSDTWAMYYNFDQFLLEMDRKEGRGVGLFGRFGASAGNPNPVQYFYSLGIGGKGMFDSRRYDRFGIGAYYSSVRNPRLQVGPMTRILLSDEWGFEAYYNFAITPWLLLTPDIQVIGPAARRVDTTTVLGFRLQMVL